MRKSRGFDDVLGVSFNRETKETVRFGQLGSDSREAPRVDRPEPSAELTASEAFGWMDEADNACEKVIRGKRPTPPKAIKKTAKRDASEQRFVRPEKPNVDAALSWMDDCEEVIQVRRRKTEALARKRPRRERDPQPITKREAAKKAGAKESQRQAKTERAPKPRKRSSRRSTVSLGWLDAVSSDEQIILPDRPTRAARETQRPRPSAEAPTRPLRAERVASKRVAKQRTERVAKKRTERVANQRTERVAKKRTERVAKKRTERVANQRTECVAKKRSERLEATIGKRAEPRTPKRKSKRTERVERKPKRTVGRERHKTSDISLTVSDVQMLSRSPDEVFDGRKKKTRKKSRRASMHRESGRLKRADLRRRIMESSDLAQAYDSGLGFAEPPAAFAPPPPRRERPFADRPTTTKLERLKLERELTESSCG